MENWGTRVHAATGCDSSTLSGARLQCPAQCVPAARPKAQATSGHAACWFNDLMTLR